MKKIKSLSETNIYIKNPILKKKLFDQHAIQSTIIEIGIKRMTQIFKDIKEKN